MAVSNRYKVPLRQWRKWSPTAKRLFNSVYSYMNRNQDMFQHPKAVVQTKVHWKTTAWNAAWIAACDLEQYYRGD